jgi:hypothetical protein
MTARRNHMQSVGGAARAQRALVRPEVDRGGYGAVPGPCSGLGAPYAGEASGEALSRTDSNDP